MSSRRCGIGPTTVRRKRSEPDLSVSPNPSNNLLILSISISKELYFFKSARYNWFVSKYAAILLFKFLFCWGFKTAASCLVFTSWTVVMSFWSSWASFYNNLVSRDGSDLTSHILDWATGGWLPQPHILSMPASRPSEQLSRLSRCSSIDLSKVW